VTLSSEVLWSSERYILLGKEGEKKGGEEGDVSKDTNGMKKKRVLAKRETCYPGQSKGQP